MSTSSRVGSQVPQDPVEMTRALVAVPSVNPGLSVDGAGEGPLAAIVGGWLEGWGFEVERHEAEPGRPSLLARLGSGRPRTILNGHLDTVGVEGMTIDPFEPAVRDGRLHGRGSCDMKSGVAAILAAARAFSEKAPDGDGELLVVLTADEEHASIGLRDLLARGLAADRAVVAEPTSLGLHVANKGFCWAEIEVRGRAAHGSKPEVGRDAIRQAGRILAALDEYEAELARLPAHPLLGRGSIHAGTIRGGTAPSVYPARCELVLEARILPGESLPRVMSRLEGILARAGSADPEVAAVLRPGLYRPGAEVAGDAPVVRDLARACREEGLEPRVEGMTAWVESAWLVESGIPALCFGPGSIDHAHSDDESVPVEEIGLAARVLERFLLGGAR